MGVIQHIKVAATKVKDAFLVAYHRVGEFVFKTKTYAKSTVDKAAATKAGVAVKTTAAKVSGNSVFQKIAFTVKSVARSFFRLYPVALGIEVAFRFISNPKGVKRLFTDWRNNHRRLVSVLWSALTGTAAFLYMKFVWTTAINPICLAVLAVIGGVALFDYVVRQIDGEFAFRNTYKIYAPARKAVTAMLFVLFFMPFRIAYYTPAAVADFIAPAYAVVQEDIPQDGEAVVVEVQEDSTQETVEAKEETFDSESVPTPAEANIPPKKPATIDVDLDGDEIRTNPRKAGQKCADELFVNNGVEAYESFRKVLPKHLRKTGITSNELVLFLKGYDEQVVKL